jgi:hypothetical protein
MIKQSKKFTFTDLFIEYKGKWVALNENESKLVGVGNSIKNVVKQAKKRGIKVPIVFKVPKRILPFVGMMIDD